MLSNANQEYQVYQISVKVIKDICKQICYPKNYSIYYQETSSMLTRNITCTDKKYQMYWQEISSILSKNIKYASKEISNMLSRDLLKLLSRNFQIYQQVCYQNNIKLVMYVLQKTGTYSGCHSAWSIRPTCQSLRCDIMAVGTYWYHSDWLWPLTNRCTNAVFRPSALTGTARSLYSPIIRPLALTGPAKLLCESQR